MHYKFKFSFLAMLATDKEKDRKRNSDNTRQQIDRDCMNLNESILDRSWIGRIGRYSTSAMVSSTSDRGDRDRAARTVKLFAQCFLVRDPYSYIKKQTLLDIYEQVVPGKLRLQTNLPGCGKTFTYEVTNSMFGVQLPGLQRATFFGKKKIRGLR